MSKRDDRVEESSSGGVGVTPRSFGLASGPQKMWLSDLSIRQPVFITMLTLAVMVVGGIFYSRMGLDLFPDVSLPVAVVQTVYPGANPEEVERSVTKPIEDAVASINGVESVRSTSTDSVSLVLVEFQMEKDGKEVAEEVRSRVERIRNTLPADAEDPVVVRFDPSATPILSIALADTGGKRSPEQLRQLADDTFKPHLERVPGVAAVETLGGRVRQVQVHLNLAQLESYAIAPQQIVQAIRAENLDVPAGRIPSGTAEELLRTAGAVGSLSQLGEIPIAMRPGGVTIRLREVATIAEGYEEVRALSRLDGAESVVMNVRKQSGTNTVQVADAVKAELARLQGEHPDVGFAVGFDQSTFTREAVQDMQFSLLLGAILASLVVLIFFRDARNTLVTVAGLPVILAGTAATMHVLGLSMNMITMMALSLSVGMLIDDAIVVRENIFRHMEEGEAPKEAARHGTAEIALAVVAVTSTIVAVFLPIAFTGGIAGRFLRDFGLTVAVSVAISLVEAFTLAPMLSAFFFKQADGARRQARRQSVFERLLYGLNSGYRALLGWSLRHRLVVVLVALVVMGGSIALLPRMGLSFMPESDRGEFSIAVELKPGARLADTDRAAQVAERVLLADEAVRHVFATVGATDGAVEKATLNVKLHRRGRTESVIERLRPELERALPDTVLTVDKQTTMGTVGQTLSAGALLARPIQFVVQGEDFAALDSVSAAVVERLREVPGAVDVGRSIKEGRPERAIVVDQARAARLGVTKAQVGATVRALVNGERAGSMRSGGEEVDIVVRLAESDRSSPASVLRLPMLTPLGSQVPLSSFATMVQSSEPSQIERENRQRQVVVGAGYQGRDFSEVLADARASVAAMDLPDGVRIKVAGQAKYMDEMFESLGFALALSVLFVYMILASQFGSFVHPFTIMLALPFSVVGALFALYLGGFSFDMLGMIGIILLMGLVTKNSILLVEFTNQLKRRGLGTREAVMEAGPIRLRPILMTTLAMIFGMVPVAAGIGAGAELRQPMGVSVIGGLVVSTLLTLVLVPVAYSLIDDLGRLLWRREPAGAGAQPQQRRRLDSTRVFGD